MRFRWADCELDREARLLVRAGRPARVQGLVLDLLLLLLRNRGRVVSEEVVRRELWPEVRVDNASVRRLLKEARRVIGDDGERQEHILTVRGRGFRFAAPVHTDEGWDASFVGRGELLESLEQRLELALEGRGGVSLLHGAAGIGKTRALGEIEARAELRGFRPLRGSGRAGGEGDAFHLWLEAAADLGLESALFGSRGEAVPSGDDLASSERRHGRFLAVERILARAAAERPLLLALDDLQFADADSLALLRFVSPSLRSHRVWVVGSFRSGADAGADPRLRDLGLLAASSASQVLSLGALTPAELGTVVSRELRVSVSASSAELLSARTDGNPLLALEVARSLRSLGRSLADEPPDELGQNLSREIGPLVARRCAALADDARRVLFAAAALGFEFEPRLLEAVGDSPRGVGRALAAATAIGVLEPAFGGKRRFVHPLIAEALYAELAADPAQAAAQHLRIAEAIERLGAPDPFGLARHFVAAQPLASAQRVLPYVRAAADEAWRRSALANAAHWYGVAVEVAERAGAGVGEVGDLLLAQSELVAATAGLPGARVAAERAARIALTNDEPRLLARAALVHAHRAISLDAEPSVVHWLTMARGRPSGVASLDVRVASRLGAVLANAGGSDAERSDSLLEEAEREARRLADPFTLGRVLFDVNAASFAPRDPHAWLARAEEWTRSARASGDIELEFRGLVGCTTAHMQLGNRAAAESTHEECRRQVAEHPTWHARAMSHGIDAMFALLGGRWKEARAAIDASESDARGAESGALLAQTVMQRFWLAVEEGGVADALPQLVRARARAPRFALLLAAVALGRVLLGELEPALDALNELIAGISSLPFNWYRLPALALAAEVTFRANAPIAAAALQAELTPYAGLGIISYSAATYYGSVTQALGWLAAARGRSEAALEQFERAQATHTELGSAPWSDRSAKAISELARARRARPRAR